MENLDKVSVSFTMSDDRTVVAFTLSHDEPLTNEMLAEIFSKHASIFAGRLQ